MVSKKVAEFKYTARVSKLHSLNNMYQIGRKGKAAWTFLNPSIQKVKDEIHAQLRLQGSKGNFEPFLDGSFSMEIDFKFIFRQNFWVRDVDNMVKYTSDAFTEASGLDDRYTIKMSQEKVFNNQNDNEFVIIEARIFDDKFNSHKNITDPEFQQLWSANEKS